MYTVLSLSDINQFANQASQMISQGWRLIGGATLTIQQLNGNAIFWYTQAFTR